jgi:uncharacterized NAD(P)/FAD-binding protein YdhS
MVTAESLNGHSSMVFPSPPSGSLVPLLSDANEANMDDPSLPFSTQIFELQAAANALISRIVEHIRHQSPELRATNDPIVQALREEQRQMWNTIEEWERERLLLTPLVTVSRGDPHLCLINNYPAN